MEVTQEETKQIPRSASTPLLRQRWQLGPVEQAEIVTSTFKQPQMPSVKEA